MDKTIPTKQKIVICAVDLFSAKGYAETSVRDIAAAVGIKPASLYNHFSSKDDLLLYILNDFSEYTETMFNSQDLVSILRKNPTAEGISKCIMASISRMEENDYYLKVFDLVYKEQHRIDSFGDLVLKRCRETINYIDRIFNVLKTLKIINNDANADNYWGVIIFSLLYAIPNLRALSLKQDADNYIAIDKADILRYIFDVVLNMYGLPADNNKNK